MGRSASLGMIRRRQARDMVARAFRRAGLGDIDLDDEIGELDLAVQQKIEIARAIFREPRILLLDEPTSTLSGRDVDWLGDIIARCKRRKGVTTVFISHRLREVRAFCDTMTVLRNGKHIATGPVADFDDDEVIRMIVGRSLVARLSAARRGHGATSARRCWAPTASRPPAKLREASFSLHAGEILGVAGLQGMGQLDLFLACFGMADLAGGTLRVDGKPIVITSPVDAVRANIGISLVPGGPQDRGAVPEALRQAQRLAAGDRPLHPRSA